MTIGGALSELKNLLKADDIPIYYKPSIKAVIDTITLEQEPKWIPVSEGLPEDMCHVWITCISEVDDREPWVCDGFYNPYYHGTEYSKWGNIPMLNWGEAEVIAWMKQDIPEPYKESEE